MDVESLFINSNSECTGQLRLRYAAVTNMSKSQWLNATNIYLSLTKSLLWVQVSQKSRLKWYCSSTFSTWGLHTPHRRKKKKSTQRELTPTFLCLGLEVTHTPLPTAYWSVPITWPHFIGGGGWKFSRAPGPPAEHYYLCHKDISVYWALTMWQWRHIQAGYNYNFSIYPIVDSLAKAPELRLQKVADTHIKPEVKGNK